MDKIINWLKEDKIDFEERYISGNTIFMTVGVYGESYEVEITVENMGVYMEVIEISFRFFEAMNTIVDIIDTFQKHYNGKYHIIYGVGLGDIEKIITLERM